MNFGDVEVCPLLVELGVILRVDSIFGDNRQRNEVKVV